MDVSRTKRALIFLTAGCFLPAAGCFLPAARCLLPAAYCQVPELPPIGGGSNNPRNDAPPLPPLDKEPAPPPLSIPPGAGSGDAARLLPPVPATNSGSSGGT